MMGGIDDNDDKLLTMAKSFLESPSDSRLLRRFTVSFSHCPGIDASELLSSLLEPTAVTTLPQVPYGDSKSDRSSSSLSSFPGIELTVVLASCLSSSISFLVLYEGRVIDHVISNDNRNDDYNYIYNVALDAAKSLTNLAAIPSLNGDSEQYGCHYHGPASDSPSWCRAIVKSTALIELIGVISDLLGVISCIGNNNDWGEKRSGRRVLAEILELSAQCCWAIGNLAGDSQVIRDAVARCSDPGERKVKGIDMKDENMDFGNSQSQFHPIQSNINNPSSILASSSISYSPAISTLCRVACLTVSSLFSTSSFSSSHKSNSESKSGNEEENYSQRVEAARAELCRNAVWALSNLARGCDTPARPFLRLEDNGSGGNGGLTSEELASLLSAPVTGTTEAIRSSHLPHTEVSSFSPSLPIPSSLSPTAGPAWCDVRVEASWLLAFLTAREDDITTYLCGRSNFHGRDVSVDSHDGNVVTALVERLVESSAPSMTTNTTLPLSRQSSHTPPDPRLIIPCVRAVGNLASAGDGTSVSALLLPSTSSLKAAFIASISPSISHSLARIIQAGSKSGPGESGVVAAEAAWAAGTLLCDVGSTNDSQQGQHHHPTHHPSTIIAAPVLVPFLGTAIDSEHSCNDLRREALSALWNAVAPPPSSPLIISKNLTPTILMMEKNDSSKIENNCIYSDEQQQQQTDVRDEILDSLFGIGIHRQENHGPSKRVSSFSFIIPNKSNFNSINDRDNTNKNNNISGNNSNHHRHSQKLRLVKSIVRALSSSDVDAVLPAISLIDTVLRSERQQQHRGISSDNNKIIRDAFDSAGVLNDLEDICDRASATITCSSSSSSSQSHCLPAMTRCAELAADLINVFLFDGYDHHRSCLYNEEGEDIELVPGVVMMEDGNNDGIGTTSTGNTRFDFGIPTSTPTFIPSTLNGIAATVGTDRINSVVPVTTRLEGREGMGRGRGRVVPAWLAEQQLHG